MNQCQKLATKICGVCNYRIVSKNVVLVWNIIKYTFDFKIPIDEHKRLIFKVYFLTEIYTCKYLNRLLYKFCWRWLHTLLIREEKPISPSQLISSYRYIPNQTLIQFFSLRVTYYYDIKLKEVWRQVSVYIRLYVLRLMHLLYSKLSCMHNFVITKFATSGFSLPFHELCSL